ncbi:thiamine biosynthesis lipoprotein [Tahibacter aquaticus]|uniref:FAD:protein FMN transferase n=1 Tax=Tahibacter aquaticus TaxID=520092 RepID=A0A4R6YV62_9GAMM|nr:DUF2271 domain-containing protein [Tahibacter aquaticus]TDR42535.1 thiamine biosynthesis lipoprotein [Tahibacter aquaticus]
MTHALYGVLLALALFSGSAGAAPPAHYPRENVLGTSFDMQVAGAPPAQADAAAAAALAEIARLDAVLSVWQENSELARFNRSEGAQDVSTELRHVLRLCERWRAATANAFSCRLGELLNTWRSAETTQVPPDRAALRKLAGDIQRTRFDAGGDAPLQRPPGLQFETDGLAKGWIIDQALHKARAAAPAASGIKIDIGGDAFYWGEAQAGKPWRVGIADPLMPRDNGGTIATLELRSRAIAASGHTSRGVDIARKHYSHILTPRDGWPVAYAPSSVVVAPDAATADALATALTVLPIREGLDLVEKLDNVEALIVAESGARFASSGWHALLSADTRSEPAWPAGFSFTLDYEIPRIDAADYTRPYLAIWIAAADGTALSQLLVLGDNTRWLQLLPQWWRRHGRANEASLSGIARATRKAGRYSLDWNGRDDQGRALPAGNYVVHIEAAREHGAHETLQLPFTLSNVPFQATRQGQSEIGRVSLQLGAARTP